MSAGMAESQKTAIPAVMSMAFWRRHPSQN